MRQPAARVAAARARLHRAGMRATRARLALLAALAAARQPLSAGELRRRVRADGADRATVFRSVKSLLESGIVHRAYTEGREARYELADRCGSEACHPHFVCSGCGAAVCFYDVTARPATGVPAGFVVERRKLLLFGRCPRCSHMRRAASGRSARR